MQKKGGLATRYTENTDLTDRQITGYKRYRQRRGQHIVEIKTGQGLTERKTDIEDGKETDRKQIDIEKEGRKIERRQQTATFITQIGSLTRIE